MKKEEKKEVKKVTKSVKKVKVKKTKKGDNYLKQVVTETKKVKWPEFKEVVKYSIATLVFCAVLALYFQGLDFVSSFVRGLFN